MAHSQSAHDIVLASGSPYRAQLLARLGLDFETLSPEVDETPAEGESGQMLASRLAQAKAAAVGSRRPSAIVIGSDQVAECRGRLMGKPGNRKRAIEQLLFCNGSQVVFHTAVAVEHNGDSQVDSLPTRVAMRSLELAQIERYVDIDRPFDCAGAMKSEALGICLAERINSDDPTALIGLPLTRVVQLLARFGIALP